MIIAREKKNSNLAEYIIYMWQLEDMLRALQLDMSLVKANIVDKFDVDETTKEEIYEWYDNLIAMIKLEKKETSGHIQVVQNAVDELTELHFYLLHEKRDMAYHQLVTSAINNFVEFRNISGVDDKVSDIELALNALYGVLMLKLQNKEVNADTQVAMTSFSKILAYLSKTHIQIEENTNTNS